MYRPPYEQPNRFNFLFFSNHDNALLLDAKDRRYCVLKTDVLPHPDGNRYYGPLFDWTRRNGPALLWYLKHEVDLSDFQPKAHAPMSAGKRQMIMDTMPRLDKFIHEHVEAKEYPFRWDLQKTKELADRVLPGYGFRVDPTIIAEAFKRLGYLRLGRVKMPGENGETENVNLWAVRNVDMYRDRPADQLRQMWQMQVDAAPGHDEETANALVKQRPRNDTKDDGAFQ